MLPALFMTIGESTVEYKSTLNMASSGFPMRAGLPAREPDMLKAWQDMNLYQEC